MTAKATKTIVPCLAIFALSAVFVIPNFGADDSTNTYPDPGYTLLGCYRDEDPAYFDYGVGVILNWSGDTFPNKKTWWQEYKDSYETRPNAKYRIISGYFGIGHATQREEGLTVEKVRARLDALLAMTRADRPVDAALVYEFKSDHPLTRIRVQLDGAAPGASRSRNEIALSVDGKTWSRSVAQAGNDAIEPLTLAAGESLLGQVGNDKGSHRVFVRVRMQNDAGKAGVVANQLDHLTVQCANAGVALWWNDWGSAEQQGPWAKFFHAAPDRDIDRDGHGGYIKLDSTTLTEWGTQRIDAPAGQRMHEVVVDWGRVEAYKKRGGCWIVQASPTGAFAGEETELRHDGAWGRLLLDLRGDPAFTAIPTMYLRLKGSNSYNHQSSYAGPITVIGTLKPE